MSLNTVNHETTGGICGILYIIKGIAFSFIISLLLILAASALLKAFSPRDTSVFAASLVINFLSTLFSGFYMSRHALKSGLLNGALAGILYFLIIFLTGSVISGGVRFSAAAAAALGTAFAGGAIGGIFGINSIKPQRRR